MQLFNKNQSIHLEISSNRTYLMGIAMLIVLVYHLFCWVYNPIGRFNIGFVGVDIFLFLSGFGLRESFERNSIRKFYYNRIVRILPIYIVAVTLTYLIFTTRWSFTSFINNLLTIGIYTEGGINRYDWYLESLFTLYFTFPLFFYTRKTKYYGLAIFFIAILLLLHYIKIEWWHQCLISRIPIFFYGIIFKDISSYLFKLICIIGGVFYIPIASYSSMFLASTTLVPLIIMLSLKTKKYLGEGINRFINYLGEYSLEIYIANVAVSWTLKTHTYSIGMKLLLSIIIQIITTLILIKLNRFIQSYIKKIQNL